MDGYNYSMIYDLMILWKNDYKILGTNDTDIMLINGAKYSINI